MPSKLLALIAIALLVGCTTTQTSETGETSEAVPTAAAPTETAATPTESEQAAMPPQPEEPMQEETAAGSSAADEQTAALPSNAGISPMGRQRAVRSVPAIANCSFGDGDPTVGATNPVAGWYIGRWGRAPTALIVEEPDENGRVNTWYVFDGQQSVCRRVSGRIRDDGEIRLSFTWGGHETFYRYTPVDADTFNASYRARWGHATGQVSRVR